MTQEEIEQGFAEAGWELDGSFYEHLIIGYTEELSILTYPQPCEEREISNSSFAITRTTSAAGLKR